MNSRYSVTTPLATSTEKIVSFLFDNDGLDGWQREHTLMPITGIMKPAASTMSTLAIPVPIRSACNAGTKGFQTPPYGVTPYLC